VSCVVSGLCSEIIAIAIFSGLNKMYLANEVSNVHSALIARFIGV